jgi:hypothetical protein
MYILYTWDIWTTYEHFFGIIYAIVYKVLGLLILDYFTAKIQYITNFSGLEKWVLWTGMKSCSPCSSCREKAQISVTCLLVPIEFAFFLLSSIWTIFLLRESRRGLEIWRFAYELASMVGIGLVVVGDGNFDISFAVRNLKRVLLSKGLLILFILKNLNVKKKRKEHQTNFVCHFI